MKTYDILDDGDTNIAFSKNPPYVMPMLFNVYDGCDPMSGTAKNYIKTLVLITNWDLTTYHHGWWGDEDLKDKLVLQPDVDLTVEQHEFTGEDGELDAIKFIRQWWVDHPVKEEE